VDACDLSVHFFMVLLFFVTISAMFYGINYPVVLLLCNTCICRLHLCFAMELINCYRAAD